MLFIVRIAMLRPGRSDHCTALHCLGLPGCFSLQLLCSLRSLSGLQCREPVGCARLCSPDCAAVPHSLSPALPAQVNYTFFEISRGLLHCTAVRSLLLHSSFTESDVHRKFFCSLALKDFSFSASAPHRSAQPRNGNEHSTESISSSPARAASHCAAKLRGGEDGPTRGRTARSPLDPLRSYAVEQSWQGIATAGGHGAAPKALPCTTTSPKGGTHPCTAQRPPHPKGAPAT